VMQILIANGSAEVRNGIRDILSDSMPGTVFLEASDRKQTLSMVKSRSFSIALLDINTPGSNGLDLLCEIKELHPNLPVILFGMQPEEQYEHHCVRAGAAGYVSLQNAPELLLQVIEDALTLKKGG